jgi:hypothetical protein
MLLHTWYKTAETFKFDEQRQRLVQEYSCYSRFRDDVFDKISSVHLIGNECYSLPVTLSMESRQKYDSEFYSLCSIVPYSYYFYNYFALWRRSGPIPETMLNTLYNHFFNLAVTDKVIAILGIDFVAQLVYHQISNMHSQSREMIERETSEIANRYGLKVLSQSDALVASYDYMLFDMYNCLALDSADCDPIALMFFDAVKFWRFSTATVSDKLHYRRVSNIDEVDKELLPIIRGELPIEFQTSTKNTRLRSRANHYFNKDFEVDVHEVVSVYYPEMGYFYNSDTEEEEEEIFDQQRRSTMFEETEIQFPSDCDGTTNKYAVLFQCVDKMRKQIKSNETDSIGLGLEKFVGVETFVTHTDSSQSDELDEVDLIQLEPEQLVCDEISALCTDVSQSDEVFIDGQSVSSKMLDEVSENMLGISIMKLVGCKRVFWSPERKMSVRERMQMGEFFWIIDEYSSLFTLYFEENIYYSCNDREFLLYWILVKYLLLLHYRKYYLSNQRLRTYDFPLYVSKGGFYFGFYDYNALFRGMMRKMTQSRSKFKLKNDDRFLFYNGRFSTFPKLLTGFM